MTIAVWATIAGLGAGLVGAALFQVSPIGLSEDRVNRLVEERLTQELAARDALASDTLGPSIENYLLSNPRILERVSDALKVEQEAETRRTAKKLIDDNRDRIFSSDGAVMLGNPDGDVTMVEFYDYNCGYCRRALPDVAALLAEDPELKLVLRQFPILTQGSVDAAKVGIMVARAGVDYWAFHQSVFASRGQVDLEVALREASALGLDPETLRADLDNTEVATVLSQSFALAKDLGIGGTPTFILGDEIIPGAVGLESLRQKIANVRSCGSTICP